MQVFDLPYARQPAPLFERLLPMPHPVLLESAAAAHPHARFDIMAAEPSWTARWEDDLMVLAGRRTPTRQPLAALGAALGPTRPAADGDPPFCYGYLGWFGYPLRRTVERQPAGGPREPTALPPLWGGWYPWSVVTDHRGRTTRLHVSDAISAAERRALTRRLAGQCHSRARGGFAMTHPFEASFGVDAYTHAFRRVQAHIAAGDCYQINLARHFRAPWRGDSDAAPWAAYRALSARQAAPFSAFFGTPFGAVLSFSPERFLEVHDGRIESCPIKGTVARQPSPAADRRAHDALVQSAKDRAENLMIVDLIRNDLGRVCTPGSIVAEPLFDVLALPDVYHLVSTVRGGLRPGVDALHALAAAFPGGSITGAPKVQAMRIIDTLEPVGRSVYCGAIGYVDASGRMDTNIAIRTLVIEPETVHCWGGGGLVADSVCEAELAEIDAKVGALMRALEGV